VILLRNDGAALLQHRDDKPGLPHAGMWVPPGGHAEPAESPEACARREFLEETGYVCEVLHWLEARTVVIEGFPTVHLTVFWSRYDGVQRTVCREGQALEFVGRDDSHTLQMPDFVITIWDRALEQARDIHSAAAVPTSGLRK
jgi:8-oxo-dGTP pyrophosphatase MutT (NUDIX family)